MTNIDPNMNPVDEDLATDIPPELVTPPTPEEVASQAATPPEIPASTPVPASSESPQAAPVELPVPPEGGFEDPFMVDWDDEEMATRQAEYERLLADAALDEESEEA